MSKILLTDVAITPTPDPAGTQTAIYSKTGSAGLFYKQGSTAEVGPLGAGGGGGTLQDAYDASTPATISVSAGNGAVQLLNNTLGDATAPLDILVSQATATGPGISVVHNGVGVGLDILHGGVAPTGHGIHVNMVTPGSAASGVVIDMTSSTATGDGIAVTHSGNGRGISVTQYGAGAAAIDVVMASTSTKSGLAVDLQAGASGNGIEVTVPALSTVSGIQVNAGGASGSGLYVNVTGAGLAATFANGTSLVTTDGAKVTADDGVNQSVLAPTSVATQQIEFNGASTTTLLGDTGVAGSPIHPRLNLTAGPTDVGHIARTNTVNVKSGGTDLNTAPYNAVMPTCFLITPTVAGANFNLPDAASYPNGTEIMVINIDPTNALNLVSALSGQQIVVFTTGAPILPESVSAGAGRRVLAWDSGNGGVGSRWSITTGVT